MRDLSWLKKVGVGFPGPAAEGAEFAADKTNVREVDIAVHDVGDQVARKLDAQQVGCGQHAEQVITIDVGECAGVFAEKLCFRFEFREFSPEKCGPRV